MEVKYLNNLFAESRETFARFKHENVLNSDALREMFSPKYLYRGKKKNTVLVKSLVTNEPAEVFCKGIEIRQTEDEYSYDYHFYDSSKREIGHKYFCIKDLLLPSGPEKEMRAGYMSSEANDLYSGVGIREEELQVKKAIENGINIIPRSAVGPATLYHIKMGYLPVTDDLLEVQGEYDVNRYMNGLSKKSPDIRKENFTPIIIKDGQKYYIDVSLTQTVANVKEIKDRLAEGETKKDIGHLRIDGVPMALSGKEFEYWKSLIYRYNN